MACELCEKDSFDFYITFCRSHPDEILIVATHHRPNFTAMETAKIRKMFQNRKIRWEMRSVKDHAHAHIE